MAGYDPTEADMTAAQQAALEAVAMDMWEPYIAATRDGLPNKPTRRFATAARAGLGKISQHRCQCPTRESPRKRRCAS